MRFRKIKRLFYKYLSPSHSTFYLSDDCSCSFPKASSCYKMYVKINGQSQLTIDPKASIKNVKFYIGDSSIVHIGPGVKLENIILTIIDNSYLNIERDSSVSDVDIFVINGSLVVSRDNYISKGNHDVRPKIDIENGSLVIGSNNNIKNSFIIRFGGAVTIGSYNCINEGTEIRCDESISIGSFNMISYYCDIWDTNTHSFYSLQQKKELFQQDFPVIGKERQKPITKPISIKDGAWIGKYSCILKGSIIENDVILGVHSLVSNDRIESGATVIPSKSTTIIK